MALVLSMKKWKVRLLARNISTAATHRNSQNHLEEREGGGKVGKDWPFDYRILTTQ